MSSLPTLGYWNIRGLGEPIRYMLKYAGVDFIDKRYPHGEGVTEWTQTERVRKYWNLEKFTLGLDFPNLPYFIDDDVKISQSLAIMRFLARKYHLVAEDEMSLIRQDMVESQLNDLRWDKFVNLTIMTKPDYDKAKIHFKESILPQELESLSKFLGQNEWFVGTKLNFVDFLAYETLDWMRLFDPQLFERFPNLTLFLKRFESLPAIANYMSSQQYKSWPIFGPYAKFGYHKE